MNINQDYSSDDSFETAIDAMEHSMGYLFEKFINPKQAELDQDDNMLLAIMGVTFKEIARRADAYDQMLNNSDEFSRN